MRHSLPASGTKLPGCLAHWLLTRNHLGVSCVRHFWARLSPDSLAASALLRLSGLPVFDCHRFPFLGRCCSGHSFQRPASGTGPSRRRTPRSFAPAYWPHLDGTAPERRLRRGAPTDLRLYLGVPPAVCALQLAPFRHGP